MPLKFFCNIILSIMAACFFTSVQAQTLRNPNEAEKTVINKCVHATVPLLNSFENDVWEKQEGGADEEKDYAVQIKPDVVMGVAPFNDWHFAVRQDSPLWTTVIQPYLDKGSSLNFSDPQVVSAYQLEGQKIKALKDIYIEVRVNEASYPRILAKEKMHMPGAYYIFDQSSRNDFVGVDHNLPSFCLVFGDWTGAGTKTALNGGTEFHFRYPLNSPHIENMIIILSGNEERIKELLAHADWQKINDGLSN